MEELHIGYKVRVAANWLPDNGFEGVIIAFEHEGRYRLDNGKSYRYGELEVLSKIAPVVERTAAADDKPLNERQAVRRLVKALNNIQATPFQVKAASTLLAVNGLDNALSFVENCRKLNIGRQIIQAVAVGQLPLPSVPPQPVDFDMLVNQWGV